MGACHLARALRSMDVKPAFLLPFFLWCLMGSAQNLVPNGSFENKSYCPPNFNSTALTWVIDWTQPTSATPDYFNSCSRKAGVPKNMFGNQEAQDGEAYLGIVTFTPSQPNYREYVQCKLDRPLTRGEMVCLEYYVSPGDGARYVTDGFGGYFSKGPMKAGNKKRLPVTAHVGNPDLHFVDGYQRWTKISDVYIAEGGESHLTFGNFRADRDTRVLRREDPEVDVKSEWAYLYLDNVIVAPIEVREECSCANDILRAGVHNPPLQLEEVRALEFGAIHFGFDQRVLNDSAVTALNGIACTLARGEFMQLRITGHTDVIGPDGYNMGLSQARADVVMDYLVDKGIPRDRLKLEWKGSAEPVAENATAEGRARNRRVSFEVEIKRYSAATPR